MPEPMDAREVTFTNETDDGRMASVSFQIGKMLPIEAKRVFIHNVRPLLGGITRVKGGGDVGLPQIIVGTITEAPADQYDILVQKLYANIKYSTQEQPQFMPLARDEENAFKDLDMGHLLALEVRAFHVNFQRSYGVLLSEFPQLQWALQQLSPTT